MSTSMESAANMTVPRNRHPILVVLILLDVVMLIYGRSTIRILDNARRNSAYSEAAGNESYPHEAVVETVAKEFGPESSAAASVLVQVGKSLYREGRFRESVKMLERGVVLSKKVLGSEDSRTLSGMEVLALGLSAMRDNSRALVAQREVLEARTRILGPEHPSTLIAKENLGFILFSNGDLLAARTIVEEVLEARTRVVGPKHPDTFRSKGNLAFVLGTLGDLSASHRLGKEVLEFQLRHLGAEHEDTLLTKENLAQALYHLGEYSRARDLGMEVLEARTRRLGSQHPDTLRMKGDLALVLGRLGDSYAAQSLEEEIYLARKRILGPEHPETLVAKGNLAMTLLHRGNVSDARRLQEEVLNATLRVLGPEHPQTLMSKANLATILRDLGDFSGAQERLEEVFEAFGRLLGPVHPSTLTVQSNLAAALHDLGNLSGAQKHVDEVFGALSGLLGPEHPTTLTAKANRAGMLVTSKDLADLRHCHLVHLDVLETRRHMLGEEHPDTLLALLNLALVLRANGNLEASCHRLEELIAIRRSFLGRNREPNTIEEAWTFLALGMNQWDLGLRDPDKPELLERAFFSFLAGLRALEAQTLRADYSEEVRIRYKARFSFAYHHALATALARDRPGDAFHVLERYRTQSLLDLLRWGHPSAESKIPEQYHEELATIGARYDFLTREIDRTHPNIDPDVLSEQAELRRRREVIQGQILEERRAELGMPAALGTQEIRRHLDPGTLLLAYSIGDEGSHLFVLDREGPIEVHTLETEAQKLEEQVNRLRALDIEESTGESRLGVSDWLYDELLAPAAERIDGADRLLILPDGPLHYLHFAALTRPANKDPRGWQYLIEHKPVHTSQSGTVYAELQSRRSAREGPEAKDFELVGFGGIGFAGGSSSETRTLGDSGSGSGVPLKCPVGSTEGGSIWSPSEDLPYSESEILRIRALFPAGRALAVLGREATEAKVREVAGRARFVHFATHGVVCETRNGAFEAVDSYLALSRGDGTRSEDNGLLQVWEIIDHLQLDADLVVLSACDTALGPERRGEGLISLSRAFQIAGARSVLASLWAVSDESTTELMIRFYRHLLAGQSKDEALRSAQMELIRGPITFENSNGEQVERDFSAPYHWAAFQLIGDWK